MKIRITLELEFADLSAHERAELEADMEWEDGEADPLPTVADYTEDELRAEAGGALTAMFDGDYSTQAELWAGSNFYGWVKSATVVPETPPTRAEGQP